MIEHELLYKYLNTRQASLREQVRQENLLPASSFRSWLSLSLHRLAKRLEPKPLTLPCETC